MNFSRLFKNELFWHALFWLAYLVIRVCIIQLYPGPLLHRLGIELIELPLKILALYLAIYLIKKYLLKRRYVIFFWSFVAYVVSITILNRLEDFYIVYSLIEESVASTNTQGFWNLNATFLKSSVTRHEDGLWNLNAAFVNLIYIYPVVGLGAAAYFAKGWYDDHYRHEQVVREKLQIELKMLKDQLHPHFLFNTLNNLYSLSLSKSDKLPDLMLRLSKLLEFMLYDGSATTIPLSKEIQALRDYIELEKIRLGDRLQLTFEASGEIEGKKIAPLLIFPFVENCFKHGSHKSVGTVWTSFNLFVSGNEMTVQIENSLPSRSLLDNDRQSGIGLENVRRRLSLLYDGRHELKIVQNETYLVKLKILLQ